MESQKTATAVAQFLQSARSVISPLPLHAAVRITQNLPFLVWEAVEVKGLHLEHLGHLSHGLLVHPPHLGHGRVG